MQLYPFIFCLILSLSFREGFAQSGNSSFYPEGYGKLFNKEHANLLSITTGNNTDLFFDALEKRFGAPKQKETYTIYHTTRSKWSKEKVFIFIEHAVQAELDGKMS